MNNMTLVSDSTEQAEDSEGVIYRDRDPSEQHLFHGKDEMGREGWFLRLEVTGMYTHRCGPFETRERALKILERFAYDVEEAFTEVTNWIHQPQELCVAEGIPCLSRPPGGDQ